MMTPRVYAKEHMLYLPQFTGKERDAESGKIKVFLCGR
jgi:hypothetical protein